VVSGDAFGKAKASEPNGWLSAVKVHGSQVVQNSGAFRMCMEANANFRRLLAYPQSFGKFAPLSVRFA
jgi:hypothetical protein